MPPFFRILLPGIVLGISIFIGKIIAGGNPLILAAFFVPLMLFFTLKKLENGLFLLLFAMLLSPELKVGEVPGRSIVVRIDDIIILLIFFSWLAWAASRKEMPIFLDTPLLLPLIGYTLCCILFTLRGIMVGYISFSKSIFYVAKYIEYFLIYFLVINIVKTKSSINKMLKIGLVVAIIVCLYGYTLIGKVDRIYAPFDVEKGGGGEAATLGGYLLLIMSQLLAFFCYSNSVLHSIILGSLFLFTLPVLAYTLSRASFLGFAAMLATLILFTARKKLFLISSLLIFIAFAPIVFPKPTKDVVGRIKETFAGPGEKEKILGFKIGELSALARIKNWKKAFLVNLPKEPLFGFGVTGVGLMDAQYPLVLGEVGIIGFFFFLLLLYQIFRVSLQGMSLNDITFKSMSLGLLAGYVGLIFQAFTTNTFIIIRIMEPFWFLVGLVTVARTLKGGTV